MKKVLLIILLILLYSCKEVNNTTQEEDNATERYDTITLGNRYSLLIPESLERTDKLNDIARIQFQNKQQDFYIIVIDQLKEGFYKRVEEKTFNVTPDIEGYFKVIKEHFGEECGIKNFKVSNITRGKINSNKAITFTMTGECYDGKYSVFYRYSIVESKLRYYQIMGWTNITNADKTITKMNKIINSFKIEEK
ncbi:MAG: hypothetical protein ABI426_06820 [Flavobacterium sp.]